MGITSCCFSNRSGQLSTTPKKSIILGMNDIGKSTLFYTIQRLCCKDDHDGDVSNFESNLTLVISNTISTIYSMMIYSGYDRMEEFKGILSNELNVSTISEDVLFDYLRWKRDGGELLVRLWKLPIFREFYETHWTTSTHRVNENMEQLIGKIESKILFDPFLSRFCYNTGFSNTVGLFNHQVVINGVELDFVDFGASRKRRIKWASCFENCGIVLYVVSLSNFNQSTDEVLTRMEEGLDEAKRVLNYKPMWKNSRIIILFSKPDILMRKLRKGVKYNRQLNYDIRPELNGIAQYNDKLVVNSIVTDYLKALDNVDFESFHIINMTSEEEVNLILNKVIYDCHQTTIISPCLLPLITPMQTKLYLACRQENLTDLILI